MTKNTSVKQLHAVRGNQPGTVRSLTAQLEQTIQHITGDKRPDS